MMWQLRLRFATPLILAAAVACNNTDHRPVPGKGASPGTPQPGAESDPAAGPSARPAALAPGHPGAKAPQAPPPYTAADAGADLVEFLTFVEGSEVKLTEARLFKRLYKIRYEVTGTRAREGTAWMTRDGRWVSHNLVDIETRTDHMVSYKRWVECLRRLDVRVFVNLAEKESKSQVGELGPFAERLIIDCAGRRTAWCKSLGRTTWPSFAWKEQIEVGLRKRDWIERTTGCKLQLFQEVAAPETVDHRDLGARVLRLHQLADKAQLSLVSTRRDGEIWIVTLARGLARPEFISATATVDGVYLMETPLELAAERKKIASRRAFLACLKARGTRFFVRKSHRDSMRWLADIGDGAGALAVDCDHPKGKVLCEQSAVDKVPAVIAGKARRDGPASAPDVEAMTGCKP